VVAFASGVAAVSAVLGSVLRPGDLMLMPSDGYYTARMLAVHKSVQPDVEQDLCTASMRS